jgi:Tol biopolymer transport system component
MMTMHRRLSNPGPRASAGSRLALVLPLILAGPCLFSDPVQASTERVSVTSSGTQANGPSESNAISADGRFVAFRSYADNLVPGDTNGTPDIFVHDRITGTTERVSVSSNGMQANGWSDWPAISADGRLVAFYSHADNLIPGDTNGASDIFVHDRVMGTTEPVSVSSSGAQANYDSYTPALSADGRVVAFYSLADNLVPGDTNAFADVYIHDRVAGTTERIETALSSGTLQSPVLSADGRFVAFISELDNLVPGDTNGYVDTFVHDRLTGTTERVNVSSSGVQANHGSDWPAISADGRFVAFASTADNLVPGDPGWRGDTFVRDRLRGTTERVSVSSSEPTISADGRFVAFLSQADNLVPGDTNETYDAFVYDRETGMTERVSVSSSGAQASGLWPTISANGRVVAFLSGANNLVPGDTNNTSDIFIHDRESSSSAYLSLASLADLDHNAAPELAALRTGPATTVVIRDSLTKAPLGPLAFDPAGSTPLGLAALADSGGAPALAVLFTQPNGRGLVQMTDARSGEWIEAIPFFGQDWRMRAIATLADSDGADALAVLAEKADGTQASIQVTHAATQVQRRRIGLPLSTGEHYLGLANLPSLNDNASPELAALRQLANGVVQVIIKDSATGAFVHTIGFQSLGNTPLGIAGVAGPGGAPEVAVLWRQPNGRGLVQVRDAATRSWVRQIPFFGAPWEITALTALDIDQDGVSEIAVLAQDDEGTRAAIQVRDAETKQPLRWIELPLE